MKALVAVFALLAALVGLSMPPPAAAGDLVVCHGVSVEPPTGDIIVAEVLTGGGTYALVGPLDVGPPTLIFVRIHPMSGQEIAAVSIRVPSPPANIESFILPAAYIAGVINYDQYGGFGSNWRPPLRE